MGSTPIVDNCRGWSSGCCPDAVIAADALEHGIAIARPRNNGPRCLANLGINLGLAQIDIGVLRRNFTQTALDRMQLVELVRDAPDIDGDGINDLDITRVATLVSALAPSWDRAFSR